MDIFVRSYFPKFAVGYTIHYEKTLPKATGSHRSYVDRSIRFFLLLSDASIICSHLCRQDYCICMRIHYLFEHDMPFLAQFSNSFRRCFNNFGGFLFIFLNLFFLNIYRFHESKLSFLR